jgi:hypothetical protein
LAIVAPVTNAPAQPGGRRRVSSTHFSAISSTAAATGDAAARPAFWSQVLASQFAASAAGSEPPMTKPK